MNVNAPIRRVNCEHESDLTDWWMELTGDDEPLVTGLFDAEAKLVGFRITDLDDTFELHLRELNGMFPAEAIARAERVVREALVEDGHPDFVHYDSPRHIPARHRQ